MKGKQQTEKEIIHKCRDMKTAKHKIKESYANLCLSLGQPPNKSPSSVSSTLMLSRPS